ncbi:dihydroorotate dehydrogenase electron transfer subunit [Heyndrickxia acidicola]|uniref:Dihydroorotate dehydrogenase B (NAD(+)), electron transfer subunit n=1 Tax=Heyndrickxia acidicola TaxID=209389 RepID=A0ABU6MCX3_9BACI|nr:dihydroorotate dehydrogenase electron transfer subunit [Heyndrickxia acidicola]MED1202139.1 dihydroorotate dehydrogenase electron transfer subunit [Heyndrickxia acidicola]
MIIQENMEVVSQQAIAENIYELKMKGHLVRSISRPGQFVHIRVGEEPLLRRPISIAEYNKAENLLTVLYRAEGKGTKKISEKQPSDLVDVLGPLGNGFPTEEGMAGETALLVGGGIGVPPLYELSRQLTEKGVNVIHVLGFETAAKSFYTEKFEELGPVYMATVDGSKGQKGFVTEILDKVGMDFDVLFSCGPIPMLMALEERYAGRRAYISLEERMGCGIGACFACVCHVKEDPAGFKYKKVCSDGPVFPIGEVVL